MRSRTMLRRAVLPALFAGVLPAAVAAQSLAYASAPSSASEVERAEELHAEASRLSEETSELSEGRMRRIASLHARAAGLFSADDPRGVECLRHAANLLHRVQPARAVRLQESAADRALARGDVLAAAHGYLDAASLIARLARDGAPVEEGWAPHARKLADRARLLAGSPLISPADRAAIEQRIR